MNKEKFLKQVEISQTGCWNWKKSTIPKGYGKLNVGGKFWLAHRYSYELFVGTIGNFQVLHRCDNMLCCNPKHLFLGDNNDNMQDKVLKNRQYRPNKKRVGPTAVREIRRRLAQGGNSE